MKSKFLSTALNRSNKKIETISKVRLATGLLILLCWFYPVVFNSSLEIFYPFSLFLIMGFVVLVYKSSRLREFKEYLIQREMVDDRRRCQSQTEFKYTSQQTAQWNSLLSKVHFVPSPHWDDLDLIKPQGLLQSIHFTHNPESLQLMVNWLEREPLSADQIRGRQQKAQLLASGPRRKALTILTMNPDVPSSLSTQKWWKEPLVDNNLWLYFTYAYYMLLWGSYAWYLASGATVYGVMLFGLIFVFIGVGQKIKISKTYTWVVAFEAQLARLRKIKKIIRFYSAQAQTNQVPLLASFVHSEKGVSFDTALTELNRIIGAMGLKQNFILYAIVHALLPWDFYWTVRAESLRRRLESVYLMWLQEITEFEAYALLAEYSQNIPNGVWPTLVNSAIVLRAKDLRHPLIPVQVMVGNDVDLNSSTKKCVLLTGSNMSGKSTFLRTLGVNLMLMRIGAKVHARVFESAPFQVLTSLKRVDSLEESLSTFYSEVKTLKEIRFESVSHLSLYLIDEIFRGTNNRERLIGAQRYIKALLQSASVGLITTHDLELSQMDQENDNLVNEHFADSIEKGKMTFDYKKKMGPCPSTNALKVMEMEGVF